LRQYLPSLNALFKSRALSEGSEPLFARGGDNAVMRCVVGHDALRAMAAHLAASDITSGRVRSSRSDGKHDQSPDDRQMVLDSGKHVVCLSFLKLAKHQNGDTLVRSFIMDSNSGYKH
jgi:hypothetical protein